MANPKHLEILKSGVDEWNKWRKENENIRPDLREADLSGANLREADLRLANLSGANLREADLRITNLGDANLSDAELSDASLNVANLNYADLRGANLNYADLRGADLHGADLRGADLHGADLRGAGLCRADLREANLSDANLHRADLSDANLSRADLSDANLSRADLSRTDLIGANLRKADLCHTDLNVANLSRADLCGADLSKADVHKAYLREADLCEANLRGANLRGADLSKTDLSKTNLSETNFTKSRLHETNFNEGILHETVFGLTDLSTCKRLDSVKVSGECIIDFQTLRNSKNIPKDFFFKIGLPEIYIDYLPEFYDEKPLRLFPVFLSHSWKDKRFAGKLYEALTAKKVLVWYDEKKLKPGDDIREGITKGIDFYDKLIIVCSENSLKNSWWVDRELDRALKKEERLFKEKGKQINTIIPVTIDDYVFHEWDGAKKSDIDRYVIGDFRKWQDTTSFKKVLDDLIAALNVDREDNNPISFL